MIKIEKNGAVMTVLDEIQFEAYRNVGWKRYVEKTAAETAPQPHSAVEDQRKPGRRKTAR